MQATDACPCGSGEPFGRCCLPLHQGERQAATAEELMRSRYSAYAVGDLDYVWQTWHPRTRPEALSPGELIWTGLQILDTVDGEAGDEHGEVEFRAHYRDGRERGTLHERSRFAVRARRWFYVDGDLFD
ncbi:SEC-C motif-containing protein [Mycobacterium sp. BK086]|uniref:YchJ family protein n=1 Tax=Mycobacterium sp. BK086 TaxID=2512165 RepID=UPI00105B9C08|nr:YchJ family metal-binding protein [Mycobacterium sp. BK086]TDO17517.1 SEC-C motif-containing protein [Mycobacterium sp. BK086]